MNRTEEGRLARVGASSEAASIAHRRAARTLPVLHIASRAVLQRGFVLIFGDMFRASY